MSHFQQSIDLCLSRAEVHGVCVAAILGLRWRIAGESEGRIACQEAVDAVSQSISPVRIVLSLTGCSEGPTRVMLNGAAFGSGSEQRAHVRRQVELLARSIEGRAICLAATLAKNTVMWSSLDWGAPEPMRSGHDAVVPLLAGPDNGNATITSVRPRAALPVPLALAEAGEHDH